MRSKDTSAATILLLVGLFNAASVSNALRAFERRHCLYINFLTFKGGCHERFILGG